MAEQGHPAYIAQIAAHQVWVTAGTRAAGDFGGSRGGSGIYC
jgi:hypothetical protein